VTRALEMVRLPGVENRMPSQLSGGQQQRIAMARAIVIEPDVLLMDEPLSALDENLREEMRREVDNLQQMLGVTTIFVTHDQREALEHVRQDPGHEGRPQAAGRQTPRRSTTNRPIILWPIFWAIPISLRAKSWTSTTEHVNVKIETGDVLFAENKGGFPQVTRWR
jgi:hypothetical protein